MSLRHYFKTQLWSLVLFALGMIYYVLIQVSVTDIKHTKQSPIHYTFSLHNSLPQNVKLHLRAKRNELLFLQCAKTKIDFPLRSRLWFEKQSEEIVIPLKRGETSCQLSVRKNVKWFTFQIEQKLSYVDYSILFILLGIPLYLWLFRFFILGLTWLKSKRFFNALKIEIPKTTHNSWTYGIWAILAIGIVIRILYFNKFGIAYFQHDWHGHVEFIKYMQSHWELPLGSKGLQFPQQPFYYFLTAGIYALERMSGMSDVDALYGLGYLALLCSVLFLYYGYMFFTQLTTSLWVQAVALAFIAFTPSIVYMSARINNDVLVMALSAYALFYMAKGYQVYFSKYFYRVLVAVSLLFLTKISTIPFELVLFLLLVTFYLRTDPKQQIEKKIFIFGIVGLFLLGFTLLRVYLPIEEEWLFVNSSANFPGQIIEPLGINYFSSFHLIDLVQTSYSHIFGVDSIRYSFLTYQYGTLLFGEFDYQSYVQNILGMKEVMQAIILFGLFIIVGFVGYIISLYKAAHFEKFLFLILLINFTLILKFISSYAVVCNTDFRYYVMSFLLLAFFMAKGLFQSSHYKWLRYGFSLILSLLALSEILFFVLLLSH